MNFRGTFEHTLDAKHRLTIPAKFRAELAGGVVLALTSELEEDGPRTVAIWKTAEYEEFTHEVLAAMNPLSPKARVLKRFFHNTSFDTELDAANRVMIPPNLMSYAKLDRDVVVTGSGDCLEVWDRTVYAANLESVISQIPQITASLGDTA